MDGVPRIPSAEELALEAQGGSVRAFEGLVERFQKPLYHYLRVRTGDADAAEDLTQEAFLRAWRYLDRYDARWHFSTWLYTLAQRLAISAHRSRGRDPLPKAAPEAALADVDAGLDPTDEVAKRDEGRALWDLAARTLDESDRSILWLRYAEDLSIERIAEIVDLKRVTVRVRLFRARERLAKAHAAEREAPGRDASSIEGVLSPRHALPSDHKPLPGALERGARGVQ
jgi:RNA polymerase sigma-70 factor (ECF subfamily)